MGIVRAVNTRLESGPCEASLNEVLRLMCDELSVDRISLHAINEAQGTFRVVAAAGRPVLAVDTELPISISTQITMALDGQVFRRSNFDDESFGTALESFVRALGFKTGVSVPLFLGSRPVGAITASCVDANVACDPILEAFEGVAANLALALHARETAGATWAVVCHDDPVTAEGIARIAEHVLDVSVRVCGTYEALVAADGRRAPAGELLICDMAFDGRRLDEFLPEAHAAGISGPVLIVASNPSKAALSLAVRVGVLGFVARSAGPQEIEHAILAVHSGRVHGLDRAVAGLEAAPDVALTPQEARVLVLLERGLRFKQIAIEMSISESTAKGYARNLFAKLGATSRSEAVYFARRCGLLDLLAPGGAGDEVTVAG
ncbi:unannotated protein [freshwater metagenome]|uniref:Unannotated protein n=1 Tax=freshwater metagenome TaxID=449393 RepID=A0A6J7D7E4_9ZZZZ|nr:hypothetical protein [Actinomycetota bacterium]